MLLNGTIMGIPEAQMMKRMDSIAAFADVGAFFDQPMETYSSGMFMRVPFAAAVHADRDILFIDEALAVGAPNSNTSALSAHHIFRWRERRLFSLPIVARS